MKTLYVGLQLTILCVCGGLATADDRSRSRDNRNAEGSSNSSDGTATSPHIAPDNDTSIFQDNETQANQSDPSLSSAFSKIFLFHY